MLFFILSGRPKNLDPRNRIGVADQARAARQAERENSDSREISGLPRRFKAVSGLSGAVAESPGPGDNSNAGNRRRVVAGKYPLRTQAGTKYVTLNYTKNTNPAAIPRPGLELAETNKRREILIHPVAARKGHEEKKGHAIAAKRLGESAGSEAVRSVPVVLPKRMPNS